MQLWPQLEGHPTNGKSESGLKLARKQVPGLTTVVNRKTHARHYVDLKEAATWILNGVPWFSLEQPTMIAIWIKDWQDAAKFQHLLQILQVNFQNYIPKWQIFVEQDDDIPNMIIKWRYLSTENGMVNQR